MADPVFDPELAAQLDRLSPPPLPDGFAARLAALAAETPQLEPLPALPTARTPMARWRAIGRRARIGIAMGGLGLAGLCSVSAAAAGYFGAPVNHAVHKLPVVGKLIEKVIPEKPRRHKVEAEKTGLGHDDAHHAAGLRKREPRPEAADAPPLLATPPMQPVIALPNAGFGRFRPKPDWVYTGPKPRDFPPGPERRAAVQAFREFRAAHPLPPEVAARRARRAAFIAAQRGRIEQDALPQVVQPGRMTPDVAPGTGSGAEAGSTLTPAERREIRIERQRRRMETWRMGIEPLPLRPRWQRRDLPPPEPKVPGGPED